MRVTILARTFPKLSETFVVRHALGLITRGVDVHVVASDLEPGVHPGPGVHVDELLERVTRYRLPRGVPGLLLGTVRSAMRKEPGLKVTIGSLRRAVQSGKLVHLHLPFAVKVFSDMPPPDILHCHFGPMGLLGIELKRLGFGRRVIVTFHGFDLSREVDGAAGRHPYAPIFEEADLILPVSALWRERLLELGAPEERTHVHHMGVDLDTLEVRPRAAARGTIRIITTARLTEKKGLRYAIEAVSRVVRDQPGLSVKYDIVGDGPQRGMIRDSVRRLGLVDVVRLHGALPHEQVKALLAQSDLFLLPSVTAQDGDQEGIPVSLMEAMAVGMPVVSTRHSGIPELVEDEVSGFLVEERDVAGLTRRIADLAHDPELRAAMGRAGRRQIKSDFDLGALDDRLIELYEGIL